MTTVLVVALVATVQAPTGILADVKVGCSKITPTLIASVYGIFNLNTQKICHIAIKKE